LTNSPTGNTDPYVYPGTNVLRNLRDIRDLRVLAKFEMDMTTRRVTELGHSAKPGKLNTAHLNAIHRYIFQDVYPWAGEFRTVNISRSNQPWFARPEYILPSLDTLFSALAKDPAFDRGVSQTQFCARAAYYMGELNAIHPFRDGNGRTQREFIRQLALKSSYSLNWSRITRAAMTEASIKSFQEADSSGLAAILQTAIDPLTAEA
jgi:cell filamentation protein